jgi:L-threonylcarbamoyladenylate synthase
MNAGAARETRRLAADAEGIAEAAALLRAGRLVAFPTETVYGLGADARQGEAVAAIFEAKGRPRFNPLILHVADVEMARRHAELGAAAERLAAAFWPGPLTLVLARRADSPVSDLVTAGLPTIAVRVPAHPVARALVERLGRPIVAPSANPSGRVSPTSAAHVLEGLAGRIAAVLDGGPCRVGIESSIVDLSGGAPALLRPGGLPAEEIEARLGRALAAPAPSDGVRAPGQLASHYAPGVRLRLGAAEPRPGEGWLGFGPVPPGVTGPALTLSRAGDLREAAANLFAHLRALDQVMSGHGIVAVARIPEEGLGRAINDRLRRAAAPRG